MDSSEKTNPRIRGNTPVTVNAAYLLRKEMTDAEKRLWSLLRNRQVDGLRFRTQHPVGPYILDFYCPAAKLAVEVDGMVHDKQQEQDLARTEHLSKFGYRVVRCTNQEVLIEPNVVIERIRQALQYEPEQADSSSNR
jgi:very-short-patch-repair endonuclease